MAKGITLKDKNGGTLYPKTVADLVLDSETGEPIGKVITSMGKIKADDKKKWLRVEGEEGKRYFVELTELSTPDAPTLTKDEYDVVTGNCEIQVNPHPTGATMEYKIDKINEIDYSDTWKQITKNTITYATGYTNDNDNKPIKLTILLRAEKNGEESDKVPATIDIKPKVASGSVTVTRTPNDNAYATKAKITCAKSDSKDATSEYSTDSGVSWKPFTNDVVIDDITEGKDAGVYGVRAKKSGYTDATEVYNSAFTLNAKKAYYGGSTNATLTSLRDIQSLGNSKEASTYSDSITFTTTEESYIWLCCTGKLGTVYSDSKKQYTVPFNSPIVIEGYNCYRRTEKDIAAEHTLYF